jgi:hypothetical protein
MAYFNTNNNCNTSSIGVEYFFIPFLNSNNYTIYPSDMDNKYIFCLIYNNGKTLLR